MVPNQYTGLVMFWLWLGLKAMALALKNPRLGHLALAWLCWLWLGLGLSHGFKRGICMIFGFGLTKLQAEPKPRQFGASQSQSQAIKPWLFGLRSKPEHHYARGQWCASGPIHEVDVPSSTQTTYMFRFEPSLLF